MFPCFHCGEYHEAGYGQSYLPCIGQVVFNGDTSKYRDKDVKPTGEPADPSPPESTQGTEGE